MHSSSRNRHLVALTPLALALVAMSAQAAEPRRPAPAQRRPGQPPVRARQRHLGAATMPTPAPRRNARPGRQFVAAACWPRSADSDGTVHYRYQQTFRGVPIFGEHVIVSEDKAGNVRNLFGRAVNGLAGELPATAPKLATRRRPCRSARRADAGQPRVGHAHRARRRAADDLHRRRQPRAHDLRRVVLRRQRQGRHARRVRS